MSAISEFQYNFQNDSTFRKKSLFIGGSAIGLVILVGVFIWLNFKPTPKPSNPAESQTTKPAVETKSAIDTKGAETQSKPEPTKTEVTPKSFDDISSFNRVDTQPIGYTDSIFVKDGKLTYINDKYLVRSNQTTVQSPEPYSNSDFFDSPEGIIINEPARSSILKKDGQISSISDKTSQFYPVNDKNGNTKYYFLAGTEDKKAGFYETTKLDLSDKKLVSIFESERFSIYQSFIIRKLGDKLYLIASNTNDRTGSVDFYEVVDGAIKLQKELKNVDSIQIGGDKVVYTSDISEVDFYKIFKTFVVDFKSPKLDTINIDVAEQLKKDLISGDISAKRCQVYGPNLYCLIKRNTSLDNRSFEPDVLAKIDYQNKQVSYILRNVDFSAASLYVVDDKNIYFVGQENRIIYKINSIDK